MPVQRRSDFKQALSTLQKMKKKKKGAQSSQQWAQSSSSSSWWSSVAVSAMISIHVKKMTQPSSSPNSFMQQNERKSSRTRSPRRRSPSGRMSRWPCKDYLRGTCNNSFCEKWHPPECLFYKTKSGCRGKKSDKKLGQKSSERQTSDARQLGCVFQDMTPPKSILQKCTNMPKPIQRVKFKKAIARHTKIRDQNPSLGYVCQGEPHQRSPNAPKFEDRSQEETGWQEQGCPRNSVEAGQKCVQIKKSMTEQHSSHLRKIGACLHNFKPEEREFVVDSGASMHMISKDLSHAEMDTLTKPCSPTTVITANGEVQAQEEAIVCVKELDIFLTVKVLDNTPAVLSLGKLYDENGYSYEKINGQKPHLIKDGIRIICNTENFVPIVVPGLTSSSSTSSSSLRTPIKQENHSSSSSLTFSPTVGEDESNSDISPVPVSNLVDDGSRQPDEIQANKTQKPNKKETTIERGNLCDDPEIPEWLQEFRENLVDDEVPVHGDSHVSSSHEVSLEPTTKRRHDLGKQCLYSFPYRPKLRDLQKDQNYKGSVQKTQWRSRTSC